MKAGPLDAVRSLMLALAGVLLIAPVCLRAAETRLAQSPEAAFDGFIAAFNRLDWAAFRTYFADEAAVFNPDVPSVPSAHRLDGRESVEQSFRAVFEASAPDGPKIVPERVRVQRFGDVAVVSFEFRRSERSFGRRTLVLNRRDDGWKIVHLHASNVNARE